MDRSAVSREHRRELVVERGLDRGADVPDRAGDADRDTGSNHPVLDGCRPALILKILQILRQPFVSIRDPASSSVVRPPRLIRTDVLRIGTAGEGLEGS